MPAARGVRGHACLLTSTAPYKDGWSEAIPIATRTGVDGYRFAPPMLRDCMMRTECRIFLRCSKAIRMDPANGQWQFSPLLCIGATGIQALEPRSASRKIRGRKYA